MNFKTFIYEQRYALSKSFCSSLIKKFEKDQRKGQGITGGGYRPEIKQSTDLIISSYDDYKREDDVLFKSLAKGIDKYEEINKKINPDMRLNPYPQIPILDSGYQMQRTKPGEFYTWHSDFGGFSKGIRLATYIWYLNDVEEGGETEFFDGTKIKPETGKLIIFPAYWNYLHRGVTPKKDIKYIITGWLLIRPEEVFPDG